MFCLRNGIKLGWKDSKISGNTIEWENLNNHKIAENQRLEDCISIFQSLNNLAASNPKSLTKTAISHHCRQYLYIYQQKDTKSLQTQLLYLYLNAILLTNDPTTNLREMVKIYLQMMITDLKNVDMNTLAILIIFNEEEKFKEAYRRKLGTSFVANKIFKINSLNFDSPKTNLELWQIDLYRTLELRSITSFDKSFIKFLLEGQYKNDDWLIQHLVRQYFLTEITLQTFTSFVKPNDPRSLIFKSQSTGLIQTINQTTKFDYLFSMCFANLLYLTPGISADFDDIKQYLHLTNSLCDELPESNKSVSYFYWSVVTVAQHKFTDNDKIGYIQELVTRILHYHIPAQKFFLEPEQFANENFINFWNDVKDKYKPYLCTKVTNVNEISGNEPIEVIPYLLNQMFLKFDFEQRKNILSKLKNKLKDLDFNNKELNGNVIVAMIETAMSCNEFSDLEEMLEEWSFVCIEENGTVPEYVDYIWNE